MGLFALQSVSLIVGITVFLYGSSVLCCNGRYGGLYSGGKVDYSFLDHLDASKHPTLSEKINKVLKEHYGWGWNPKPLSLHGGHNYHGHGNGHGGHSFGLFRHGHGHGHGLYGLYGHGHGHSYSHQIGHGHGEHGAVSHHEVNHGWPHSGHEFAAHNQKPVVVPAASTLTLKSPAEAVNPNDNEIETSDLYNAVVELVG